jgi:hypothetical protein
MLDGAELGKEMTAIVREFVGRAVAPLLARIDDLERRQSETIRQAVAEAVAALPPATPGKDADPEQTAEMVRAEVEKAVAALPKPQDGRSVSVEDLVPAIEERLPALISEAVAGIPVPKDGKDADPEIMREMIADAVAKLPAAEPGKSVTLDDVAPMIEAGIQKAVAALPPAKDGIGLAGGVIDRDGNLVLTLTDGTAKQLGRVVGMDADHAAIEARIKELVDAIPKPRDGIDAVGFDDMEMVEEEDGLHLRFTRGEVVKSFRLPVVIDRGVFKADGVYRKGDGVSWAGSFWIAQKDEPGKPDTPESGWRLAVKRGQNGKDAGK